MVEPDLAAELHALGEQHEALLAFLYAAPVGLALTDLDGRVEMISPVTALMLMPLVQQGGLGNLFDVLRPVAPDLRQRVAAHTQAHGVVCEGLQLQLSRPGQPLSAVKLHLVKRDARRLMLMLTDISAELKAERQRQQAEGRLQVAMEAAGASSWLLEIATDRLHMARQQAQRFGLADLLDGPADAADPSMPVESLLLRVHLHDRSSVARSLHDSLRDGTAWRTEFRLNGPGDAPRWLTMHGQPLRRPGLPAQMLGVMMDTTLIREAVTARQRGRGGGWSGPRGIGRHRAA